MGPKRKKSKPNPEDENPQAGTSGTTQIQGQGAEAAVSSPIPTQQNDISPKSPPATGQPSWYASSWRSKASPVATVARESISVAQGATTESSQAARPPNSVSKSLRGSRKSIPLAAEATRVHATSDASSKSRPKLGGEDEKKHKSNADGKEVVMEDAALPPDPVSTKTTSEPPGKQAPTGATWFSWWSRPDGYGSDTEQKAKRPKLDIDQASQTPLPGISPVQSADDTQPMEGIVKNARDLEGVGGSAQQTTPNCASLQTPDTTSQQASSGSWFWLWSSSQNQTPAPAGEATKDRAQDGAPEITVSSDPAAVEQSVKVSEADSSSTSSVKKEIDDRPKASAWAFWSSSNTKDPAPTPGGTQTQTGELAVADTPSENNPEAAQFNEQREAKAASLTGEPGRNGSLLRPGKRATKANSSKSITRENADATKPASPQTSGLSSAPATTPVTSTPPTPSETPPLQPNPLEASSILTRIPDSTRHPLQQARPNLILPTFDSTFPLSPNPGYIERLSTYLAQAMHLPGAQPMPQPIHVYKSTSSPKIKKAVALGIHGFFPGALIQKFIGQPRGTSVRLSNYAATAIKTWCSEHQGDGKDEVEIEKVAF